jgi:hypothetical protein
VSTEDIIELIKEYREEYAPAMETQPEDHDIIMDMGKYILCEDLLDKICPGWRNEL